MPAGRFCPGASGAGKLRGAILARMLHQTRKRWRRSGGVRRRRGGESVAIATVDPTNLHGADWNSALAALARRARHKDVPSNDKHGAARTSPRFADSLRSRARPARDQTGYSQESRNRLLRNRFGRVRADLVQCSGYQPCWPCTQPSHCGGVSPRPAISWIAARP